MHKSIDSFPNAPQGWSTETAEAIAKSDGFTMSDDHWELVSALQEYYHKVEQPKLRQVKDALDEKFHALGGIKYLHQVVPAGPVAEGCKLAGLDVPAGAVDHSFGSVA
ncbi:MAG: TusE/DsrC/DsvC family sulfur relay protein [Gammaproteobacteria bacterium]|nr:TusE/DsrC/DsvC family sulfur relay protein [Gammaproteobacteria bacterium]